ncbi:MAG TPA: gamma-glutamylcyclotransferase family protein [Pyrinomonadaceae bacterium]|jgi:gamma-glutamylcyclotransferase (GGCT)/AIG2-like uncharacterized protein YtfP|nr:gamma-glutamylcyclotransferase family protein [Pyrinomonadaceae bacterium]
MKQYLFTYGTLTEELAPQEIYRSVKKLKYIGNGFVYGRLYDLGKYPGAIFDRFHESKIFGKIYELPDSQILKEFDNYEEYDPNKPTKSLFVRKQVLINRSNQKKIKAWVYEYNRDVGKSPLIENGRFTKIAA